jgi:hypothetical protein
VNEAKAERAVRTLGPPNSFARAFGEESQDLDVRLVGVDRESAVTDLLAACLTDDDGRAIAIDELWGWTLSQRLQALLAVQLASGEPTIELETRCAQCAEAMELSVDLRAFVGEPPAPHFIWRSPDGVEIGLRLPVGRDVQRWTREGVRSTRGLAGSLVETVDAQTVDTGYQVPTAWLPTLDDAYESQDPITALELRAECPACRQENSVACDLEELLLAGFARQQSRLLADVLHLATALHWSETEIFAVPRWRRAHYLRQLESGVRS